MEIGSKVKALRIQHGLTQEELASRCELSKGFISMVENDLTSPSISTMNDLLEVFGVSMHEFFLDKQTPCEIVYYNNDYFTKENESSVIEYLVSDAQSKELEPLRITLSPGGKTETIAPHEGDMFGYVLKGRVRLNIGDECYKLSIGDSFYYSKPKDVQEVVNESVRNRAVILWISTPPLF